MTPGRCCGAGGPRDGGRNPEPLEGGQQVALLRAAAAHYGRAYALAKSAGQPDSYYPGVNLATLQLLASAYHRAPIT